MTHKYLGMDGDDQVGVVMKLFRTCLEVRCDIDGAITQIAGHGWGNRQVP